MLGGRVRSHGNITDRVNLINLTYKIDGRVHLIRQLLNLLRIIDRNYRVLSIFGLIDYLSRSLLFLWLTIRRILEKIVELRLQRHVLNFIVVPVLSELLDLLDILLHLFAHGLILIFECISLKLIVLRLIDYFLLVKDFLLKFGYLRFMVFCLKFLLNFWL